jgi:hypothetical protein
MKAGRMYRIKGLAHNRLQTVMTVVATRDHMELMTENPQYLGSRQKQYIDGDIVACVGMQLRTTHHYEKQPYYKLLTLAGEVAYVTRGTRNKYFELVK